MDEPARKRRKTSSLGPPDRASSPLKKPPRRPSFASPTKASLARFNPNLLPPRPISSSSVNGRPNSREISVDRGKQARSLIFSDVKSQNQEQNETTAGAEQQLVPMSQEGPARSPTTGARTTTLRPTSGVHEEVGPPTWPSSRTMKQQGAPRRGDLFSPPSKRAPRPKAIAGASPVNHKGQESGVGRLAPMNGEISDEEEGQQVEGKQPRPDPEFEKKKREKERLLRELQEMEIDVSRCSIEISMLQDRSPTQVPSPLERDTLISFIEKIASPEAEAEMDRTPPVNSLLCSFLPFTARVITPPRSNVTDETPVPSHRPLVLEDPLPYLEMFTSFKFISHISTLDQEGLNSEACQLHQKHTIEIAGPQQLLLSSIEVIVNTSTYEVVELEVLRLSSWTERELGKFMRGKAEEKDLSTVCWSISSYWELAKKRAEYWHKCETTFAHLIPGQTSDDTENMERKRKAHKDMSRKDLLRHLGRDTFMLEDKRVLLKIAWRIGFDWTGEAQSIITVEPAFPQVWSEADHNNSLKRIPETFNSLLEKKGAFEATRMMVALLFSE